MIELRDVQPIPFVNLSEHGFDIQEALGLLVFFRLYSMLRVFREMHPVYRRRREIAANVQPAPKFGWSLAVKVCNWALGCWCLCLADVVMRAQASLAQSSSILAVLVAFLVTLVMTG